METITLNNIEFAPIKEFCFEIYTNHPKTGEGGWDIENIVVHAETIKIARDIIKSYPLFDCIITTNDWFHYNKTWPILKQKV